MTINVFNYKNFQLKCILNPKIEKFIKSLSLNPGKNHELAVFYEDECLIFSIAEEKLMEKFKCPEARFIEFNKDNKLLIVTKKDELYYLDLFKKKVEQLKTIGKVIIAKWYPFNVIKNIYYYRTPS